MRLKEIRKNKGISQEQAASDLEISVRALQNYEYGQREPNVAMIIKLAKYYNVSVDYLLEFDSQQAPNPITLLNLPDDTEAVVDAISKLPPTTQKIMVDLLLQLSDAVKERREEGSENVKEIVRTILKTVYYDAASAGTGEPLGDEPPEQIEVVATPAAEEADCVIRVHGDSMEPTFLNGDFALVIQQPELHEGEIGIFQHNATGYIKEYSEEGLISHNPKYAMIPKRELDGCTIFGKVIGKAKLPE